MLAAARRREGARAAEEKIMSSNEKEWRCLARRVVRIVNTGWWLERFSPLLVLFSIVAAITILILRNQRVEAPLATCLYLIGGITALLGIAAWFLARSHFVRLTDGYVRMEKELRLHNALSAALDGAGPWPELPRHRALSTGYSWRWTRIAVPVTFALSVIAAALLIPVSQVSAGDAGMPNEPLAWEEMESWLEKLDEEKAVEKAGLEQIKEQIDQLRDEPEDEWFSHSSMEATDTLKQQLSQSLRQLSKDSASASRSLGALEKYSSQLTEATRDQLASEFEEALKGMQSGRLGPNSELMNALKNIDPKNLSQMSKEQMQQLTDALKECSGASNSCLGGLGMPEGWSMGPGLYGEHGPGFPNARFPEGMGINRGPGEAPISLSDDASDLGTSNPEGVQSTDYSRAAFGDTLAIGEGEHEIDESTKGSRSAGAMQSKGQGGERIWRESLLPDERDVLKRYFK